MNYILFDGPSRNQLLPFTYTRPIADIRVGILTIREKWEQVLKVSTSTLTQDYLSQKYPLVEGKENVMINASFLPVDSLVTQIKELSSKQAILKGDIVIAYNTSNVHEDFKIDDFEIIRFEEEIIEINNTWDIFAKNGLAIYLDFDLLTNNRKSQSIPETVNVLNPENIFIEEGAKINFSTLNASNGPIYVGKGVEIMEGSLIRGPLAICKKSIIKMGAKIYGPTTIGPYCKVGGEVNNSVLFSNSNKGHEGYLGNSVLGEWCNLGADTNTSNLKNNYAEVRLWDYNSERFAPTGLQFCGLMMGDHSKCGINTMFNTGTVVGVNANIFGSGYPRNFMPSFSWGGSSGYTTYQTKKAFEVAEAVMSRRNLQFDEKDQAILEHVFELTKQYRKD